MATYEVHVKPCWYACDECGREASPASPNYEYEYAHGHRAQVYCWQCLRHLIAQGNAALHENRYVLVIDPPVQDQESREEQYGTPLAPHSEHKPGDVVSYETAGKLQSGEVLHVADGAGGGLLYIVENARQGFPDVVRAHDILE